MNYADSLLIRDYVALQLRVARDKLGPQAARVDLADAVRTQRVLMREHFRHLSPRKQAQERRRIRSELEAVRKLDQAAGAPVNLADLEIVSKEEVHERP